jgi:hypothetical protein
VSQDVVIKITSDPARTQEFEPFRPVIVHSKSRFIWDVAILWACFMTALAAASVLIATEGSRALIYFSGLFAGATFVAALRSKKS